MSWSGWTPLFYTSANCSTSEIGREKCLPSDLIASVGEGLLDLLLGGLGGVGGDALLHLVGEILAAGVRHVGLFCVVESFDLSSVKVVVVVVLELLLGCLVLDEKKKR